MEKKLYRDESRKSIGGVCAGLAEYFDMDVTIIRALFVFTFIFVGTGLLAYVILWIVIPKKPMDFFNPGVDYRVPNQQPYAPLYNTGAATPGDPFTTLPPKKTSAAGAIIGCILIFFGAAFLFNEFHIFRFWYLAKAWPAVLIIGGLAMIVSGKKTQPWEKTNWQEKNAGPEATATDDTLNKEETKDDDFKETPPTI